MYLFILNTKGTFKLKSKLYTFQFNALVNKPTHFNKKKLTNNENKKYPHIYCQLLTNFKKYFYQIFNMYQQGITVSQFFFYFTSITKISYQFFLNQILTKKSLAKPHYQLHKSENFLLKYLPSRFFIFSFKLQYISKHQLKKSLIF